MQWSYVFLALTHQYEVKEATWDSNLTYLPVTEQISKVQMSSATVA